MLFKVLVVCFLSLCQAMDQHLVCKSVKTKVGTPGKTVLPGYDVNRGFPGKRGPAGKTGAPGPRGIVDYTRINVGIDKKLQSAIASFNGEKRGLETKVKALELELDSMKRNLADMTSDKAFLKKHGLCDIDYSNSCYWVIVHNRPDMNYADAEEVCENARARVADIYDNKHYDVILEYLRTKIPSARNYSDTWIGIRYKPKTRVATFQNGDKAFVKWNPSGVYSMSSHTRINIQVSRDKKGTKQGMINWPPNYRAHGVLCEI